MVRKIFKLAIAGNSVADIAKILNTDNEIPPGAYYRFYNTNKRVYAKTTRHDSWTTNNVRYILKNEVYYGADVSHKREVTQRGTNHTTKISKTDQIVIENVHEAIVTKEEFTAAQKVIRKVGRKKRIFGSALFQGILFCGTCMRVLQAYPSVKKPYYKCSLCQLEVGKDNCRDTKVFEDNLIEYMRTATQELFEMVNQIEPILEEQRIQQQSFEKSMADKAEQCRKKLAQLENRKLFNVEKLMEGSIGEEIYLKQRKKLEDEITQSQSELSQIESQFQLEDAAADYTINKTIKDIKRFAQENVVSKEMLKTLIEGIYVTDSEHIELRWKFSDEFVSLLAEAGRRQKKILGTIKEKNS